MGLQKEFQAVGNRTLCCLATRSQSGYD